MQKLQREKEEKDTIIAKLQEELDASARRIEALEADLEREKEGRAHAEKVLEIEQEKVKNIIQDYEMGINDKIEMEIENKNDENERLKIALEEAGATVSLLEDELSRKKLEIAILMKVSAKRKKFECSDKSI